VIPRILAFHGTGNLGDLMQTVALSRLIGRARAVFRDQPGMDPERKGTLVASGFLLAPLREPPDDIVLCGIRYPCWHPPYRSWIASARKTIGARDPDMRQDLLTLGVPAVLTGCATLTLPRYHGPRRGVLHVDDPHPGLTHKIPHTLSFREEWNLCLERLDLYRRAAVIHTTRLHVALPSIAMGTPVVYKGPMDARTSILKYLGIRPGRPSLPDAALVSSLALTFVNFLSERGIRIVDDGDFVMPEAGIP